NGVPGRRLPPGPEPLLARRLRWLPREGRVGRCGPLDSRAAGLCQRIAPGRPMGALHVLRPRRAGLVRLRLGDPAPRDRFPCHLPRSAPRPASLPEAPAAATDRLAAAMAHLPDHAGCGLDQAARRPVLAAAHVSLLPLRDATDSEPAQPHAALHAPL